MNWMCGPVFSLNVTCRRPLSRDGRLKAMPRDQSSGSAKICTAVDKLLRYNSIWDLSALMFSDATTWKFLPFLLFISQLLGKDLLLSFMLAQCQSFQIKTNRFALRNPPIKVKTLRSRRLILLCVSHSLLPVRLKSTQSFPFLLYL